MTKPQDIIEENKRQNQQTIADTKAAAGEYNQALEQAGQELSDKLEQNDAAYQAAGAEAITSTEAAQQQAATDFYNDIVKPYQDELEKARQENEIRTQEEDRRAVWTGAGELAAAIANMVGVGSFNASNQQYKSYSQDWMRQADANAKMRQARMDQLRNGQRQAQLQAIQQRLANAQNLASMKLNIAGQGAQMGNQAAQAGYGAKTSAAQAGYGTAKDIAGLEMGANNQAAQQAVQQFNQDRAYGLQAAGQQLREKELELNAASKGYKQDDKGNWVVDPNSPAAKKAAGSGSGSADFSYDATINGQNIKLDMKKNTFEQAVKNGREELRQDVANMLGKESWDEVITSPIKDKKGLKKRGDADDIIPEEYTNIIEALGKNSTTVNYDAIEAFINDHRSELNNFNQHLYRTSIGASYMGEKPGQVQEEEKQPQAPTTPSAAADSTGSSVLDRYKKRNS